MAYERLPLKAFPTRKGVSQSSSGGAALVVDFPRDKWHNTAVMHNVDACGIDFTLEDRGRGAPLVLVHGFPLNRTMWTAQLDAFADTHRVIAPDLRGFGGSTPPSGTMTMERYADDLVGLLDVLEVTEPVVLCGLSMGGYIALALLRKYPERVGAMVLADTRSAADTPEAAGGRLALAEEVLAKGPAMLVDAMLMKLLSPLTPERHPDVVEAVQQMFLTASPAGVAAALRGMACRENVTPLLPKIDVPVLTIVGADDTITPPNEMRGMHDDIPDATYIELPNAGHLSPMENAAAFNQALQAFVEKSS